MNVVGFGTVGTNMEPSSICITLFMSGLNMGSSFLNTPHRRLHKYLKHFHIALRLFILRHQQI